MPLYAILFTLAAIGWLILLAWRIRAALRSMRRDMRMIVIVRMTERSMDDMNAEQQRRYVFRALDVLAQLTMPVRWFSIEPLSFDFQEVLEAWARVDGSRYDMHYLPLEWVVIGAATNGPKVYQPEPEWVRKLLVHLCEHDGIPVFFKGNLRGNPAADPWLEEFPE